MKVEGRNSIFELLKTDKSVEKVLVERGKNDEASKRLISAIKAKHVKIWEVDKKVIEKESESGRSQGFIAFVSDYEYFDLEDIIAAAENKDGFIVVLSEITDPHNFGSIIRVCECAGVDGIVIGKDRSVGVNDLVMRVSEGALNHVKIAREVNVNRAIEKLKEAGYWTYGLELGGDNIYKTDLKGKICIVVGGEDSGVKRLTREKCDGIITIPMQGEVNSLNASVACGIAVFEANRQRNGF